MNLVFRERKDDLDCIIRIEELPCLVGSTQLMAGDPNQIDSSGIIYFHRACGGTVDNVIPIYIGARVSEKQVELIDSFRSRVFDKLLKLIVRLQEKLGSTLAE